MFTVKLGCNPICAWGSSKCCRREVGFDQDEMRAGGSSRLIEASPAAAPAPVLETGTGKCLQPWRS